MATRTETISGGCGCCGEGNCCGVASSINGPVLINCPDGSANGAAVGNDYLRMEVFGGDLDPVGLSGGVSSSSSVFGVTVSISATNDGEIRVPGTTISSDFSTDSKVIRIDDYSGPVTIEFSPPTGKRVCSVGFKVASDGFGNRSLSTTVYEGGGGSSASGNITTSVYVPFSSSQGGVTYNASTSTASISKIEFQWTTPSDPDAIAFSDIGLCVVDTSVGVGNNIVDSDGNTIVDSGNNEIIWI